MMTIYLKILAVFYGYGALLHFADLLSLGHSLGQSHVLTFVQMPIAWKIATVFFALVDSIAACGLWTGAVWGVGAFLLAATSQMVMYTVFTAIFSHQPGLVVFRVVTVGIYGVLWVWGK
jgi:hypothetical protein